MFRWPKSTRALPRIVVVAVSIALLPLPVLAAPSSPPGSPPSPSPSQPSAVAAKVKAEQPLRTAIQKADVRDLQQMTSPRAAARRSAQVTDAAKESPAFFKSGTGIVVLAALAAGVGYALYSTSHDRIHSPGKE